MKSQQYLYVMRDSQGLVKIGLAADPDSRLHSVQTGNPYEVELAATSGPWRRCRAEMHERDLHQTYSPWHQRGEWFDIPEPQYHALVRQVNTNWFREPGEPIRCWGCGCEASVVYRNIITGPYLPLCGRCKD